MKHYSIMHLEKIVVFKTNRFLIWKINYESLDIGLIYFRYQWCKMCMATLVGVRAETGRISGHI